MRFFSQALLKGGFQDLHLRRGHVYSRLYCRSLSSSSKLVLKPIEKGNVYKERLGFTLLPLFGAMACTCIAVTVTFTETEQSKGKTKGEKIEPGKRNKKGQQDLLKEEQKYSDAVCGCTAYAANKPIEDRHFVERLNNGGWWFSVFDGHGGWQCSDYAQKQLHKNLQIELHNYLGDSENPEDDGDYNSVYEGKISSKVVTRALKAAFERTDRQYMTKVYGAFELGFGRDTRAGCCALGVFVLDGVMFVANAGDSRAVTGVKKSSIDKRDVKKIQRAQNHNFAARAVDMGQTSPPSELDEDLELAALNESTGVANTPEAQRKLRQRLIAKLFAQDKQIQEISSSNTDNYDYDQLLDFRALEKDQEQAKGSHKEKESEAKSAAIGSSLVNVMSYLTGSRSSGSPDSDVDPEDSLNYIALEMSSDHNCKHERERKKLEEAHEGELDLVVCKTPESCYVKGKLQPTRAFGDFYLKYSEFMRHHDSDSSAGKYIPPPYTPPYISATPEVKVRKLVKGRDEFLILASDGLWDMISSQEAVEIAAMHLRSKGGTPTEASEALVTEALRRAAKNNGITLDRLRSLRPGRTRRTKHDDISVIVVDLSQLLDMYYWG